MKTVVDARLRSEATRYHLRFACEDCVELDTTTDRCALGYPTSPRRRDLEGEVVEFCKAFELA